MSGIPKIAETGTDAYSMPELMAVEMSRNLAYDNGTTGGVGTSATIPMAAVRLATLTVAPDIVWFCGASAGINPTFSELPLSAHDPIAFVGAEAHVPMMRTVDMGMQGNIWNFGFNGGIQVDKHGNCNMIGIGPYENLKVRGPGTVGVIWAASMNHCYLYFNHHSRRTLVEKVDYISSPGYLSDGSGRSPHLKPTSTGPRLVYTPLCVMDFTEDTKQLRLKSVNPGYTVQDVLDNSGCEIVVPDDVPATRPPTELELMLLRTQVDRTGTLRTFQVTYG
ncbi:CoA-transferase [Streptomyces sp. NPDC004542]|uniref:CoA-transferase n=1 Tax=Streptomyces sp. NPDC004542 TaxID=3154281 RepID=UPI0033A76A46